MSEEKKADGPQSVAVKRLEPKRGVVGLSNAHLGGLNWYALMVKAGAEQPVAAQLERAGLVATVPMNRVWRLPNRFARRKVEAKFALLPRYVFVAFGSGFVSTFADEVRAIAAMQRDLTLIQSVVGVDGTPVRMVATKVARFLRQHGEVVAPPEQRYMPTHREFGVDDEVDVVEGAFTGQRVKVHAIAGPQATVLMQLFGSEQRITMPLANLERSD